MNHPDDDTLRALSLGHLPEVDLVRISAHLGNCPTCCERIDRLTTNDPLLIRLRQSREESLVASAQRQSAVRALRHSHDSKSGSPERIAVSLPIPKEVGDYDILGEVGRGGMGVVYKVRHRGLQRLAALKLLLAGEFASRAQGTRFRLEAELAARVQHPNIVQVYEIGSHDTRPFLVLEWVEGGSLAEKLDGKPWPPGDAVKLVETLARAIHVAHGEGVVHRDLKPANILMAADGTPKIADFGLAQPLETSKTLTRTGLLVGTPGYMSPEQAAGNRALVGPATDIYALGVVLYQLCTGQLPFANDNTLELLRAVAFDEPIRPRRLQPRLPRDVEAIALHCLEKEPHRRYPSALALAEDLERFRKRKQVLARPVGAIARFGRACRRRPLVAALFTLLAISILAGLGGVTWKWLEADDQRDQASAEKQAALYQAYRASLAAASAALEFHDVADAARHLESAPIALRGWEWRHLNSRLDDSTEVIPLLEDGGVLIPGADRLRIGTWTRDGVRLTDLTGGNHTTLPIHPDRGLHTFSPGETRRGLRVASWSGKTKCDLFDETGQVISKIHLESDGPERILMSLDGLRLACRRFDEGDRARIVIFDAVSGKRTAVCDGHPRDICALDFCPDGTRLASCGEDKLARVWDTASGALIATCQGHTNKVVSVAFSPDGSRLATTSSDGTVRQWDAQTGREVEAPYDRHVSEVFTAVYSPNGQWVASSGFDRTIRVWRAKGLQDAAVLHGHTGRVSKVAFSPDGSKVASLSCRSAWVSAGDDTVRVWDVDPQSTLPVLRGHTDYVYPIAYSPDGRWLASGSWDGTVRLWDAGTGEPCATFSHPSATVLNLAFGPDGTWLATACPQDDRVRIWDIATGRVCKEIVFPHQGVHAMVLSPDGTHVAVATNSPNNRKCLTVCDRSSGAVLFSGEGRPMAYSPDGRWFAILEPDDKTIALMDARTHEPAARFVGHENTVFKVAFSPDGLRLASCSRDQTIRIWNLQGEQSPQVLHGHNDEVFAVAFHPDSTRLATAGRDGGVWLWDLARGEAVVRLPGHKSYVWSLAFSPDGATLASSSGDNTIRLWDTLPLRTRNQARRDAAALRPEAEQLVDRYWRLTNDRDAVVAAIRADGALSASFRHAALRAAMRLHNH